jgi:hypothetical protein
MRLVIHTEMTQEEAGTAAALRRMASAQSRRDGAISAVAVSQENEGWRAARHQSKSCATVCVSARHARGARAAAQERFAWGMAKRIAERRRRFHMPKNARAARLDDARLFQDVAADFVALARLEGLLWEAASG